MHQDLNTIQPRSPEVSRDGTPLSEGCNSPRTKIARKLSSLELEHDDHTYRDWTHSPRKRTRLSSEDVADDEHKVAGRPQTKDDTGLAQHDFHKEGSDRSATSTIPQQQTQMSHFLQSAKPHLRSPPPEGNQKDGEACQTTSMIAGHTLDGAKTWQDSEITGMTIDFAAGDDGEGIDGIAFRPTPQVAYARRQRRKQQVSEWRAREAREARVRRLERRNGCMIESARAKERLVRFVNPDS